MMVRRKMTALLLVCLYTVVDGDGHKEAVWVGSAGKAMVSHAGQEGDAGMLGLHYVEGLLGKGTNAQGKGYSSGCEVEER